MLDDLDGKQRIEASVQSVRQCSIQILLQKLYFRILLLGDPYSRLRASMPVVEQLPAKAGRLQFRLKVGLRLKPPEVAPAESRLKARWAL